MPNLFMPYGGAGYPESGNLLTDPVIPAISGMSVIKVAAAIGLMLWVVRKLGK